MAEHLTDDDGAMEVSDFVLDATGAAYMARDFEAWAKWFHLPQTAGTFNGDRVIETRDELKDIFDAMCQHFDAMGVVELRRKTLEARFLDEDTLQATFSSRRVLRGHVFSDEMIAHGFLNRINGEWRITEYRYATDDSDFMRAIHAGKKPTC